MSTQTTAKPKIYIGMDIHKKSWTVSIQTDLFFHKTYTMPARSRELLNYVEQHFSDYEVHLVYEAGCCGFSVARYFMNMGWHVMVVNPADVKSGDKQRYQKTDKLDARNLSNQLKAGTLHGIYIPTETEDQFTSLSRHRSQVTRKLRQIKSHIKSFLLFHGVEVPEEYDNSHWTKEFVNWLEQLRFKSECGQKALEGKIRMYKFIKQEYLEIANQMRAYSRAQYREDYYLLKSIPGIGGFLAAVILAECGDIRRFSTAGQFCSFVGVVPGIYASGGEERCLGITPRSRAQLRSYLIEASWIAIRKDPEMQAYYRKHQGKNVKAVIVKVAHKLTNRILAVIKRKEPYRVNVQKQADCKTREVV